LLKGRKPNVPPNLAKGRKSKPPSDMVPLDEFLDFWETDVASFQMWIRMGIICAPTRIGDAWYLPAAAVLRFNQAAREGRLAPQPKVQNITPPLPPQLPVTTGPLDERVNLLRAARRQ